MSLPANLTENIKTVIYVSFRAKRKLVEISRSRFLMASNSAFLKAAQHKRRGPHRIRTKRTAKRAKNEEYVDGSFLVCSCTCLTRSSTRCAAHGQRWHQPGIAQPLHPRAHRSDGLQLRQKAEKKKAEKQQK